MVVAKMERSKERSSTGDNPEQTSVAAAHRFTKPNRTHTVVVSALHTYTFHTASALFRFHTFVHASQSDE